jgi:hypothetical protein
MTAQCLLLGATYVALSTERLALSAWLSVLSAPCWVLRGQY